MTPASSYLIQTAADTRFSHIGRRLYSKQRSRRPKAEVIFKPKGKFAACDLSKARSRQRWLILVSLGTQRAHNYSSMLIKASPSTQTAVEEHRALDEEVARPTIVVFPYGSRDRNMGWPHKSQSHPASGGKLFSVDTLSPVTWPHASQVFSLGVRVSSSSMRRAS